MSKEIMLDMLDYIRQQAEGICRAEPASPEILFFGGRLFLE